MYRQFLATVLLAAAAARNITTYEFLVDGDFEAYGGWKINPMSTWCTRWCSRPSEWIEIAKSGDNFMYLPPKSAVVLKQSFNYTTLNISYYKYCNFDLYIRAIDTIDIIFNVHWNGLVLPYDWKSYTKNSRVMVGEWTKASFVLTGMSDSLEIRAGTGATAWFSFDDASLVCYESDSFNFGELEIFITLVCLVILYAVFYQIYTKIGFTACRHKFCVCCPRRNQFVVLQEPPDMELPELSKSKALSSSSDEEKPDNPAFVTD